MREREREQGRDERERDERENEREREMRERTREHKREIYSHCSISVSWETFTM